MTKEDCWDFIVRSGALDNIKMCDVFADSKGRIEVGYTTDYGDYFEASPYDVLYNTNDDVYENDSYLTSQEDVDWLIDKCNVVMRNRYRLYLQKQLDYIEGVV
jgi:hypothetical protein